MSLKESNKNSLQQKALPGKRSIVIVLVLTFVVFGLFLWFAYQRAWMGDDAFITLRTVDNFVNGYGLVWNVGERVQSYTSPMWMFLVSAFYVFTREAYFTTVLLSLGVSFLAVYVLFFFVARDRFSGAVGVLTLLLSSAFLDYSSSGLENPLSHLLLALFAWVYFRKKASPRGLFWLSLIASLAAFTRLDNLLIFLPALALAFWQTRSWRQFGTLLLGQIPVIAWEIFSVIYYGFPFPNTAYAKLNNGLPISVLFEKGLAYVWNSVVHDPWTIAAIVCGLLAIFIIKQRKRALAFGLGIIVYLLYVLSIGGDFMSGRFFTLPLFAAVCLITQISFKPRHWVLWLLYLALGVSLAALAFIPPWRVTPAKPAEIFFASGIADERMYYFYENGLTSGKDWKDLPHYYWRFDGENYKKNGTKIIVNTCIGMSGYYAGPNVIIVDALGLSDAFLARLAPNLGAGFRIGHFVRNIPEGYQETLVDGKFEIKPQNLNLYYQHLYPIIHGDLWGAQRWQEIIKMNFGQYNYLLK
ncbi:MAG: hypothetical protein AB9897_08885 [Anaerolineaceae bacterium]